MMGRLLCWRAAPALLNWATPQIALDLVEFGDVLESLGCDRRGSGLR
ncbi:hypothetical protein X741_27270 [Mesorhizobium sp. LNHC229A00]|nr:hypothetical protein X741_27270 [Mesorhizobium sp. LNHC229A00]